MTNNHTQPTPPGQDPGVAPPAIARPDVVPPDVVPPAIALALAALLPADVVLHQTWITPQRFALHPAEAPAVAHAVAKRQLEFAAGRHCAHRALQALGAAPGPLLVGPARAPLWPAGVVGAISHDDGWAAAAVAHQASCAGLGIDIELMGRFTPAYAASICTPAEQQRYLAGRSVAVQQCQLARLFTVKEALFKAQFPLTGAWLDFGDVAVVLPDAASGLFQATLLRPAGRWSAGQVLQGGCAWAAERACAALVLRPADLLPR